MKSARNLIPKALKRHSGYHDGAREHHSSFKHPGVSEHHGGPEWAHGAGDDVHMSEHGMGFTNSNPDEATGMTGIHGHSQKSPRHANIHRLLVRK